MSCGGGGDVSLRFSRLGFLSAVSCVVLSLVRYRLSDELILCPRSLTKMFITIHSFRNYSDLEQAWRPNP
jgi:hypothetical protein